LQAPHRSTFGEGKFALQNISGNIANSQTSAFKTVNTNFQDLVDAQMYGVSGGVQGGVD
jgi:flagellar hook protein FlgE